MGSLFSSATPSYTPTQSVATNSVTQDVPNDDGVETPDLKNEEAVRDVVRKSSRGRSSTIQTSYRGVLEEGDNAPITLTPQRKNLLGE